MLIQPIAASTMARQTTKANQMERRRRTEETQD
jgi:hypothetical protein